ncbi:MAG: hypothetical protein HY909_25710 [Deltaproteobacteria bacterium]|nr:hypothetical protein [Deltaproteobacteria bacterium]
MLARGWYLEGWHPAPPLEDVLPLGHRGETLVGVTRQEVCTSADGGVTWEPRLRDLERPELVPLEALDAVAVLVPGGASRAPRVYLSRDHGDHWTTLALPAGAGPSARVFSDRDARLHVASESTFWTSDDGFTFGPPRALPGPRTDRVDDCGRTLIARLRVGEDAFWHRSLDRGESWRPFRLGVVGVEGDNGVLRCLRWRDGIEAGRGPLPSAWSFDGGRSWTAAAYDPIARARARAREDSGAPRCHRAPDGELACADTGRLVLPDSHARNEIRGPEGCEHVRMLDDRRALAFGACGVMTSPDRGGLWYQTATRGTAGRASSPSGRGGFLDARVAWRLDGGLWWTQDGGRRWRLAPGPGGRSLERGVFVDRERGVFARADGAVLSTGDGGRSWTFVVGGELERIASTGRWVMVTTATQVRVSPDGGRTWRASGTLPASQRLDPTLDVAGSQRRFEPSPGVRVSQQGDRILTAQRQEGPSEVARGLPRGYELLAAHATGGAVDRVLLTGGVVLARATPLP